jgi:Ca-activated chloride channel homolog
MVKAYSVILNKKATMKNLFLLIGICFSVVLNAQEERKIIRQGNKEYKAQKYTEAEELYRKAIEKKPQSVEANYNTGNFLYKQNKYLDAASKYNALLNSTTDKKEKAYIYHNLGNSYLKANQLKESIDAYKESLKLNPTDRETKFNLAYAQRMVQQQQQQQDNNNNKNQEPSDYAKKIKKQADELVAKRLYSDAYKLMQELLSKDKTANIYQEYTKRLKDVVEVNSN